jgi:hypothetical protein
MRAMMAWKSAMLPYNQEALLFFARGGVTGKITGKIFDFVRCARVL